MKKRYLLFLIPALLGLAACDLDTETSSDSSIEPPIDSNSSIGEHEHKYENVRYTWSEDLSVVTASRTCSICGETQTEDSYTYKTVITPSTCKEEGVTKYTTNSFNNSDFKVQERIVNTSKADHKWEDNWTIDVEPTCSQEGSKSHHCSVCGEKKDITVIPTTRHEFGDVVYNWASDYSTLTATRCCLNCDEIETETVDVRKDEIELPTCTIGGKNQFTSENFTNLAFEAQTKVVLTPANGHRWDTEWTIDVEPTKDKPGEKSHHCLDCDARKDVTSIELGDHEHVFGEWEVVTPATCTEDGQEKRTCSICGKIETRVVEKTGHEFSEVTYTWNDDNTQVTASRTCSKCDVVETETVNAIRQIVSNPTCTEAGSYKFISESFTNTAFVSQVKEVSVPAKGHRWDTEWTIDSEATCTEAGSKSHHCLDCDAKKDVTEISALGHHYGEWEVVTPATCTSEGLEKRVCTICGGEETRVIEKLSHNFGDVSYTWNEDNTKLTASCLCSTCNEKITETVNVTLTIVKAETCTEDGLYKYVSDAFENSRFIAQTKEITVSATGHNFGEWVITKDPTFTQKGTKQRTCSICGEVETQEIAKLENASFNDFLTAIDNSKITQAVTTVDYKVIDLGVTLKYNSNLSVEYGPVIKAKYDYSYDKLNKIGSDEMMSKVEGTYYSKGNSIGEIQNGTIQWNTNTESSITFININFAESVFGSNYTITKNKFVGTVDDSKVTAFFGKPHNVSGLKVEITLGGTNYDVISDIKLTYTDTTTNASVVSATSYFYDVKTVIIPE